MPSRNCSYKFLRKSRRVPKSNENSVVLTEKNINDTDYFISLSNQYSKAMFEKGNACGLSFMLILSIETDNPKLKSNCSQVRSRIVSKVAVHKTTSIYGKKRKPSMAKIA